MGKHETRLSYTEIHTSVATKKMQNHTNNFYCNRQTIEIFIHRIFISLMKYLIKMGASIKHYHHTKKANTVQSRLAIGRIYTYRFENSLKKHTRYLYILLCI